MLRATLLIAAKDLRQRFRDRSGLVIAFVAPFLLAAIIGLAFGGGDGFSFSATYAVVDDDHGPLAARFVDGVLAGPGLAEVVTLRRVGAAEARDLVDRGEADAAFLLPAGLSASVQQGRPATVPQVRRVRPPRRGRPSPRTPLPRSPPPRRCSSARAGRAPERRPRSRHRRTT